MNRRSLTSVAATLVAGMVMSQSALAQTFHSTGANVVAGVDQNWTVSTGTAGVFSSVFGAAFITPLVYPQPNFITNLPGGSNGFAPWFTFRQTFDLSGFNALTAALAFRWGCDDVPGAVNFTPVFSLNGGATQGAGTCGGYNINAGSLVNLTSGFNGGVNTLDFFVVGNGTTDGFGLNTASFTANRLTPSSTVPEPATVVLLGTGLAVIVGMRHRRKA